MAQLAAGRAFSHFSRPALSGLNSVSQGLPSACGCRRTLHATRVCHAQEGDLYDLLGIPRTATAAEIKRAYYAAAKKHHPDTNKGDPAAAKKFADATEAYEVLSDAEKRKMYDTYGHAGVQQGAGGGGGYGGFQGGNPPDVDDLFKHFESLFGGGGGQFRSSRPRRGRDVQVQVELDLLEAAEGIKRKIRWRSPTDGERTVEAEIPAGVDTGMNLRLTNEGEPGEGGRGHVYVAIVVREHETFQRDGTDVHVLVKLTLAEAVLGGRVLVPSLKGDVSLNVPAGTQPGDKRVMQGRGIRAPDGSGTGHQYVHFELAVPRKISAKQRELIEAFGEEELIPDEERHSQSRGARPKSRRRTAFG
uniref:J domain-containing protein n=1 Tax=Coccolithus braarudii TaxID=221442 RepID=A0A7S0PXK0_9EUKA